MVIIDPNQAFKDRNQTRIVELQFPTSKYVTIRCNKCDNILEILVRKGMVFRPGMVRCGGCNGNDWTASWDD